MSERNFVLNEEIMFWLQLLSDKTKIKDTEGVLDLGIAMNTHLGSFTQKLRKEKLICMTSKRPQLY